jgi:thiamine pyrophosphokinase
MIGIHAECDIASLHNDQEIRIVSPRDVRSGTYAYSAEQGDLLSLVSFSADAMVTIRGVDWPLENVPLPLGSGGVSNRSSGGEVYIAVHHGILGVFRKHK